MVSSDPKELEFHTVGEITQKLYTGKYTVKPLLTFKERSLVDSYRRNFMGNPVDENSVNQMVQNLAVMISQIKYRVIKKEPWMENLEDLVDENVILELFEKTMNVEKEYRDSLTKAAETAKTELTAPKT